jgi:hypothetical protein
MAVNQKRIYELETYIQLDSGDVGFIPATAVYYAVDYNGWTEAKKQSLDNIFGTVHLEAGKLSSLGSRSVSVVFGTAFTGTVVETVNAYRELTYPVGVVREDVMINDLAITLSGFTLDIDVNESLTGVIIDYKMMEAQ